jgi:hypothetical protein
LPELATLTPSTSRDHGFATIELPSEISGRISFHLALVSIGANPHPETLIVINYEKWFGIAVILAPSPVVISNNLESHVIKAFPAQGPYASQQVGQDQALISFHQKRTDMPASIVTSWEPKEGVYRFVFAVPMRVPPRLTIEFANPILEACIIRVTCSEIRFKVRGPGGYIKSHPEPIVRVELSAEL